jgi:hypothetical protein
VCENSLEYPHFEVAARLAVENEKLREVLQEQVAEKDAEIASLRGLVERAHQDINDRVDLAVKMDEEISALRAVLKDCHDNVYQQKELAALVDFYYHEFFVEESEK